MGGIPFKSVDFGGKCFKDGDTLISQAVSVNAEDVAAIKELVSMGIVLGDPTTGIILGGTLEMMALASTVSTVLVIVGHQSIGAVYMTLNNPFYEVIDEEIRTVVENHGDILISRDPALSVDRQVEEIRELIDLGVTNVEDDSLVACTVVSDNYSAGVQCAEHLLKNSSGGKIALLKHLQARSSIDRIAGFCDKIAANKNFQVVVESECLGQLEVAMPVMERNITSLVGRGFSNKEIAETLFLSEGTIRNALSSALSKLNLRDRTQLAIWAVQTGLSLVRN